MKTRAQRIDESPPPGVEDTMPYSSNDELPDHTKSLSDGQKSAYRAAYNSAHEQGHDEETRHKIAWGAAKKAGYVKTEKADKAIDEPILYVPIE